MHKKFFLDSHGKKICAIISGPAGNKGNPIIVFGHGFASSKDSQTEKRLEKILNERGILTFRFDFFGRGESDGKPEDITISKAVDNIMDVLDYLKGHGYRKMGLCGFSFGGIASLMAASRRKDLYLLALKSPVSDYTDKMDTQHDISSWKKRGYTYHVSGKGQKTKLNYAFYEDARKHDGYVAARKIKVPTLIVHGDQDISVPVEQSMKTSKLLENCEFVIIPGADHQYSNQEHFEKMLKTVSDFIIKNS